MNILRLITAAGIIITSAITSSARTAGTDTVTVIDTAGKTTVAQKQGKRIEVIEIVEGTDTSRYSYVNSNDTGMTLFISPGGWDVSRLFRPRRKTSIGFSTDGFHGIYAGGLIPIGTHAPVTGGWEIGVRNIINAQWNAGNGGPVIRLGAGLGWKFQTVGHGNVLAKEKNRLVCVAVPHNAYNSSSRMRHFHFTVPLEINIPLHKTFAINLGGELHLNTYSIATSSWDSFSEQYGNIGRQKWTFKGLHQRIATFVVNASVGWTESVAAYVSWAPITPWKKGCGPQYRTLAVGATINM